jgi:hypothetical protein
MTLEIHYINIHWFKYLPSKVAIRWFTDQAKEQVQQAIIVHIIRNLAHSR